MNIAFSGCRHFTDYEFLESKLNEILRNNNFKILVGDAKGIDSLIIRYAKEYNFEYTIFKADWDQHGKSAGPIRNREMINKADGLIAFWNNESRGTKNVIEEATKKRNNKNIIRRQYDKYTFYYTNANYNNNYYFNRSIIYKR